MMQSSFYDRISKNKRDSALLIGLIVGALFILLYVFARIYDPAITFLLLSYSAVITLVYSSVSYYAGADIVLKSAGAFPANPVDHAYYINAAEGLALASGLPKPDLYVIPSDEINAFAAGRDPENAVVAVTEGALRRLSRQELEGVLAHEMSHIGNYDIRYSMLVAVFVGLVAILSDVFLRSMRYGIGGKRKGGGLLILAGMILAIFAPIAVRLVQLSISRQREFLADATGAKLTRYPMGLASALQKIKQYNEGNMQVSEAVSHLFIADPKKTFIDNIFATHPPIEERIKVLQEMG